MIRDAPRLAGEQRLRELGHMARYAPVFGIYRADLRSQCDSRDPAGYGSVALQAGGHVGFLIRACIRMRVVAGQAGQPVSALAEAGALRQPVGLEEVRVLAR